MEDVIHIKYIISALIFSGIGIAILLVSFLVLDALTPKVQIWKEIVEEKNIALAIFLGAISFGIATIIAAAIHG